VCLFCGCLVVVVGLCECWCGVAGGWGVLGGRKQKIQFFINDGSISSR
jgi:hypothetical protein